MSIYVQGILSDDLWISPLFFLVPSRVFKPFSAPHASECSHAGLPWHEMAHGDHEGHLLTLGRRLDARLVELREELRDLGLLRVVRVAAAREVPGPLRLHVEGDVGEIPRKPRRFTSRATEACSAGHPGPIHQVVLLSEVRHTCLDMYASTLYNTSNHLLVPMIKILGTQTVSSPGAGLQA